VVLKDGVYVPVEKKTPVHHAPAHRPR
jgi:hypothetical protein